MEMWLLLTMFVLSVSRHGFNRPDSLRSNVVGIKEKPAINGPNINPHACSSTFRAPSPGDFISI